MNTIRFAACALVLTLITPAFARSDSCADLLTEYITSERLLTIEWAFLKLALRGGTHAGILVRWKGSQADKRLRDEVGLGSDLSLRPVTYAAPLMRPGELRDYFTVFGGTPDQVLNEAQFLAHVHAPGYLGFQVLWLDGDRGPAFELPNPPHILTTTDINDAALRRELVRSGGRGLALYDPRSADTYFAIPEQRTTLLQSSVLRHLNVGFHNSPTIADWAQQIRRPHKSRMAFLIPGHLVFSREAFTALKQLEHAERLPLELRVDAELARRLRAARVRPEDFMPYNTPAAVTPEN